MKLKNIVLGIVAIIMIAAIAIGITVAYLTDTDAKSNTMTVGPVDIELQEFERVDVEKSGDEAKIQTFSNKKKPLIPAVLEEGFDYDTKGATVNWDKDKDGNAIKPNYTSTIWAPDLINNEVDKMVFVKNTGKSPAYVRIFFAFEAGNYVTLPRFQQMIHINLNETDWQWDWNRIPVVNKDGNRYFIATATYSSELAAGAYTPISLSQISLDRTATNADVLAFGEGYDVSVFAQAIQTVGFSNAQQAFEKGFGDNIPFTGLEFVKAVDLRTALHYLNGDTTQLKFTGSDENKENHNVNSVTFGLTKDHAQKVSGCKGVLTLNLDKEQEFTASTYYVLNEESKYDIYVLADEGVIYAPKDSNMLFATMASLKKVDTDKLDVSQTTNMQKMFLNCKALTEIDVSGWNTDSLIQMVAMFAGCESLSSHMDLSGWNVSKVTDMQQLFSGCSSLTSLNVSNWNVANVTSFYYMFAYCRALTELDLSGWNTSKVTNMQSMFDMGTTGALETIYVGDGWTVKSVTTSTKMFAACFNLVGGEGTTFDSGKIDKEYARIDGGPSAPGYLTDIKNKTTNP